MREIGHCKQEQQISRLYDSSYYTTGIYILYYIILYYIIYHTDKPFGTFTWSQQMLHAMGSSPSLFLFLSASGSTERIANDTNSQNINTQKVK